MGSWGNSWGGGGGSTTTPHGPSFSDLYDDALHIELGTNDTSVLFTTPRRKHAINEGIRQFADITECLTRQSTIHCTNASREFNLNSTLVIASADFLRVAAQGPVFQVSDSNGIQQTIAGDDFPQRAIPYLDAADEGWRSTNTGTPSGWYLRADGGALNFGLDRPVGLSTETTQTAKVILPYIANPSSMTGDTQVPFTFNGYARTDLMPYLQAAVHYAAHNLEKLRKDKEASDVQLQKFMGYVQRYHAQRPKKGAKGVRAARSYFRRRAVNDDDRDL